MRNGPAEVYVNLGGHASNMGIMTLHSYPPKGGVRNWQKRRVALRYTKG